MANLNTTITLNFKYGLVPKGYLNEVSLSQLFNANKLWNNLVSFHYEHNETYREALLSAHPPLREISDEIDKIDCEIRAAFTQKRVARQKAGTRDGSHPLIQPINDQISKLKQTRRSLREQYQPLKKEAELKIDKKALNDRFAERRKLLVRQATDKNLSVEERLYSNTADQIYQDFKNAREQILKGRGRLNFHRYDGTGYWKFRLRKSGAAVDGVSVEDLFQQKPNEDKRLMFISCPVGKGKPRIRLRATLAGGQLKKEKIYQEFDMVFHRPFPEGAQIQNAKLLRTRIGDRFRYDIVFAVRLRVEPAMTSQYDNAIGIDVGFRQMKEGFQVGHVALFDGSHDFPLYLPEKFIKSLEYKDDVKQELDHASEVLGNVIRPLMKMRPLSKDHQKFRLWKKVVRAGDTVTLSHEIAYKWARWLLFCQTKGMKNTGLSEEVETHIIEWWKRHGRRYREWHNLQKRALRYRKDWYRQMATHIVSFGVLIGIEDIDFAKSFAEVKDKDNNLHDKARLQRVLASPSELIMAIKEAAAKRGIAVIAVDPSFTSKQCFSCGAVNKDLQSEVSWRCSACGTSHHRDLNAARNIAARALDLHKGLKK